MIENHQVLYPSSSISVQLLPLLSVLFLRLIDFLNYSGTLKVLIDPGIKFTVSIEIHEGANPSYALAIQAFASLELKMTGQLSWSVRSRGISLSWTIYLSGPDT